MVITYKTARKTITADITVRIRTGRVFRDREGLVLSGPCLEGELIPERPLGGDASTHTCQRPLLPC